MNTAARWILGTLAAIVIAGLGLALDGPDDLQAAQDQADAARLAAQSAEFEQRLAAQSAEFEQRLERAARRACEKANGLQTAHTWTADNRLVCVPSRAGVML